MYELTVPDREYWDEENERFVYVKGGTIRLEHSLISLQKWEAKHKKYLIGNPEITGIEFIDYIRCMTLDRNVPDSLYFGIDQKLMDEVKAYMDDPQTATWFTDKNRKGPPSREKITNELIYYWMLCCQIPFEPCEKWHINHLLTLIEVYNHKNQQPKKRSGKEIAASRRSLNAARKSRLGTKG